MRYSIRRTSLALLLAPWLVAPVQAVPRRCAGCLLGVYDDTQMTRTTGTISGLEVKSVYLGIHLSDGAGISNLSFSAAYPNGFIVVDYTPYIPGTTLRASGDGVLVEWPGCVRDNRLLFRVRVVTFGTTRDAVLQLRDAQGASCDNPTDLWSIPASCYVMNPSGRAACATAVEHATWAGMKELFK